MRVGHGRRRPIKNFLLIRIINVERKERERYLTYIKVAGVISRARPC